MLKVIVYGSAILVLWNNCQWCWSILFLVPTMSRGVRNLRRSLRNEIQWTQSFYLIMIRMLLLVTKWIFAPQKKFVIVTYSYMWARFHDFFIKYAAGHCWISIVIPCYSTSNLKLPDKKCQKKSQFDNQKRRFIVAQNTLSE